jgi:uncharacterized membrane protein
MAISIKMDQTFFFILLRNKVKLKSIVTQEKNQVLYLTKALLSNVHQISQKKTFFVKTKYT